MKKALEQTPVEPDEMREEYDFSKMTNRVRGKHYAQYQQGTNIVLLVPNVAETSPRSGAVNNAQRKLMERRHPRAARPKQRRVVEARADEKGNITQVKIEGNRRFIPVEQAINMADRKELSNAHAVHKRDGTAYLSTNPDSASQNNLDDTAGA